MSQIFQIHLVWKFVEKVPKVKKFSREENFADFADFEKIRENKFPRKLFKTLIREIKFDMTSR